MTEESGLTVTEEVDVEALIEQNNNFKKKLGGRRSQLSVITLKSHRQTVRFIVIAMG